MAKRTRQVALFGVLALGACSFTQHRAAFVDPHALPYWLALEAPQPFPLARSFTWKYQYTFGNHHFAMFLADGKQVWTDEQMRAVHIYCAQPVSSGPKLSDVYAERGREAARGGNATLAGFYSQRSEIALRSEITNERIASSVALIGAGAALGEALGRMVAEDAAAKAANGTAAYFARGERTVIDPKAPDGSVLELYFRLDAVDGDAVKPATYRRSFDVTATLRDANGRLWRSAAAFTEYLVIANKPTVPPELDRQYLLVNSNYYVPFREAAKVNYTKEILEIQRISAGAGHPQFAILGAVAIQGIYEQLAAARSEAAPGAPPAPQNLPGAGVK